jgi:SOS response regulatory protein OraA/RecX
MWMAQQLLSAGNTGANVSSYLQSRGYTPQTIQDIFRQLGIGR